MIQPLFSASLIIIAVLIFSLPQFRFLDTANAKRNGSLDGLRFIMASFVVFHHSGFFSEYFVNNQWMTSSHFLLYIGKLGVSVFFVISSFLFWDKITKSESKINWKSFYINRIFRIAPLCMACSLASILYILYITNFPENNELLISDVLPWFDAAIFNIRPDINGLHLSRAVMAGVTWTLKWEWMFYLSLPLLYMVRKKALLIFPTIFSLLYFAPMSGEHKFYSSLVMYFLLGIICSEANKIIKLKKIQYEFLLLTSMLSIIIFKPSLDNGSVGFLSALIVLSVSKGGSLFGLLNCKGMCRLGEISYSIYLTQGIVMYSLYRTASGSYNTTDPLTYYLLTFACFAGIIAVSVITFSFIEKPCYRFGKNIIKPVPVISGRN
ncbi:acyltransferase family protein [Pseudomonas graminis]